MAVWFRAGFDLFDLCRTLSCDYVSRARERLLAALSGPGGTHDGREA